MENYAKLYHLLFNAITDALEQMESQNYGNAKDMLIAAQQKAEESISQQKTEQEAALSAASEAMPRRQKRGVDNPKRRGKAPPFWSLGVQGRDRNAPAVLLGGVRGPFSHAREWPPYPCSATGAAFNTSYCSTNKSHKK